MSDRDEMARLVATMRLAPVDQPDRIDVEMLGGPIADALWAAGWRKKPSRRELTSAIGNAIEEWLREDLPEDGRTEKAAIADAILALLDGPTNG